MAKTRIFDLPETKGAFQLKGIVTGTEKDSFYREMKTKNNNDMRIINFGVEYDEGKTLYVNLLGTERENVYFFKRSEKRGEKSAVEKVAWADRFNYKRDGYKLIGKNIGVRKKVDSSGKTVNDKKILTEFDACKEIYQNLKDGASVFIKGNLDYNSFQDDNGNKKLSVKLTPDQISLCTDVDFNDEKLKKQHDFNQVIIFMGIEKENDDSEKETGRFIVTAKVVTYGNIENAEFIIEDSALAGKFKRNLKPYNAIKVSGRIVSSIQTEIVENEDDWGEKDPMEKVSAPSKREFIITGAKGASVDKELYTQEKIEEAVSKIVRANKANNDFGGDLDENWGEASDIDEDDIPW